MNATYDDNMIQEITEGFEKNVQPYPKDRELALNLGYEWVEIKSGVWKAQKKIWGFKETLEERKHIAEDAFPVKFVLYDENNPKDLCDHSGEEVEDCVWKGCVNKCCKNCEKEKKCQYHHIGDLAGKKCKLVGYPTKYDFWAEVVELVDRGYKNIWILHTKDKEVLQSLEIDE